MKLTSTLKAASLASLSALPPALTFFALEGSVTAFMGWGWTIGLIILVALTACLIVGVPAHCIFKRKNINNKIAYAVTGFLTPVVIFALGPIIHLNWVELIEPQNIQLTLICAIAGASVATTFSWLIEK